MTLKVGINGFGRIGRLVFRAAIESGRTDIEFVAINDLASPDYHAHLLKYDSVHGTLNAEVSSTEDALVVNGKSIKVTAERNPADIDWAGMGVDLVMECSGFFANKEKASLHLQGGAKKVLISAPAGDADKTIVYGVNDDTLTAEDTIVSNASCTTNCLAPVAKVLNDLVGIETGFMTTIHSYTGDQKVCDTIHSDLHRARAAAMSMIPTSTGAAKAVGLVLPELAGKLDGVAVRVPTPNVSLVDLTFTAKRDTTVEEINAAIVAATQGELKGVLASYDAPLVSIDFNHNPNSSIFSVEGTKVMDGNFVRIMSWYDNEWGFSNRMSDTAIKMMSL